MEHVAGYSIYNDVSVRDYQRHAQQIAAGKNFVGTGPFGPWMVTTDELPDPTKLKLETRVNGNVVQKSDTSFLIFSIPRLINYASEIFDLMPGDVIATGTPAGVGFTRKPPIFLVPGDVVEVEVEKIGVLRNPVVDEARACDGLRYPQDAGFDRGNLARARAAPGAAAIDRHRARRHQQSPCRPL